MEIEDVVKMNEVTKRVTVLEDAMAQALEALRADGRYSEDFGIIPVLSRALYPKPVVKA